MSWAIVFNASIDVSVSYNMQLCIHAVYFQGNKNDTTGINRDIKWAIFATNVIHH